MDHFLLCSLHRQIVLHRTSLPDLSRLPLQGERLAFLAMVADGVGANSKGEEASRLAIQQVTQYVADAMKCYYTAAASEESFIQELQKAALESHKAVVRRAAEHSDLRGIATTLTVFLGVWPWIYVLQVGDSRYYVYSQGTLTQITRDQTMAEDLVDEGVLTRTVAAGSPLAHVLSSAIGGEEALPVVSRIRSDRQLVHLMCSDGLTKHVSDERIRQRLASMTSAKQACEALLQDALDDGGSDNITIIVGRIVGETAAYPRGSATEAKMMSGMPE
ncbi:MAG: protein phosphatase 2C domain-containing protein [Gemmatimonadales bacterium]|jgi:protein phosphatase